MSATPQPTTAPAIAALPADVAEHAEDLLDMVLNGECSWAFVYSWTDALRDVLPGGLVADLVDYYRTF